MRAYWKHLRVPFQLSLAPLFLWGYFLASTPPIRFDFALALAFCALHFFLYTGVTAYNSSYDRDTGPVGGMFRPPPAPPRLREFSLLVQIAGALLAVGVHRAFLAIYLTIAALAAAYSHPRTRWKASPVTSALTVFVGQGALGFLAGWVTARGGFAGVWSERGLLGMAAAAFTTLGLYPLTQVYQVEEDAARGDRTLAVALGPAGALRFGFACLLLAGAAATLLMARHYAAGDTLLLAIAYGVILWQVARFAQGFAERRHTTASAFRLAMRLNFLASAGFCLYIALRLFSR